MFHFHGFPWILFCVSFLKFLALVQKQVFFMRLPHILLCTYCTNSKSRALKLQPFDSSTNGYR